MPVKVCRELQHQTGGLDSQGNNRKAPEVFVANRNMMGVNFRKIGLPRRCGANSRGKVEMRRPRKALLMLKQM